MPTIDQKKLWTSRIFEIFYGKMALECSGKKKSVEKLSFYLRTKFYDCNFIRRGGTAINA